MQSRIDDLEDIIKILISMLENNNISKDIIKFELRKHHYCFDCNNHFRGCKCGEDNDNSEYDTSSIELDEDYTSSICSDNDESE